jgi:hypothetical protein
MTISAPPQRELSMNAAERAAAGKALRERVARSGHSAWLAPPDRADPLRTLAERGRGWPAETAAAHNARLAQSPFAFFRATPDVMAADLARTPASGLRVQLCGDAHCLNFTTALTPERRITFEPIDFAETAPGPWEWDLKRLAASLVLAASAIKTKRENAHAAVAAATRSYRLRMLDFATKTALETWYAGLDAAAPLAIGVPDPEARRRHKQVADAVALHSAPALLERLTVVTPAGRRFRTAEGREPPGGASAEHLGLENACASYVQSLAPELRRLYERYRLVDAAAGPSSAGRLVEVGRLALLQAGPDDLLLLEVRPAAASVLEPFTGANGTESAGERIVAGQRLMQNQNDPFLGWSTTAEGSLVVRQFRAEKRALDPAVFDGFGLRDFAHFCGSALAGAHARSGDAAEIAGYLGKGDTFDKAIVRFGLLYAAQAEQDHAAFVAAIDAGSVVIA